MCQHCIDLMEDWVDLDVPRTQQNVNNNNNSNTDSGDINSEENSRMSEEESSLAMAREFLSRLLLMLACFVILCLLLF